MAFLLVYCLIRPVTGGLHPQNTTIGSAINRFDQPIWQGQLDTALLETAIVHYANLERKKYQFKALTVSPILQKAAREHSKEMTTLHYFSHQSPVSGNQNLIDRLINAGFHFSNVTVGENIGVDYFLQIANIPFYTITHDGKTQYINANTGRPITNQTYREFARRMVQNWMKSPPHRKNVLNPQFENIGCGVAAGIYHGMEAIYATQNFSGSLRSRDTTFETY